MTTGNRKAKTTAGEAVIRDLHEMVRRIRYGTITIKVHDANIVQVELTEKMRFDESGLLEKGGGI